jgi:hypothetical protein
MASRRSTHSTRNTAKRVREQQATARDARVMHDDEVPENLEAPITYENALRFLRRQKLICRGPLAQEHRDHAAKLFKQGRIDAAMSVRFHNRGVRNPSTGDLDQCGFDLTELIEQAEHPLDGSLLEYICPKCGNEGTLRPARFNVSDRPRAAARAARS